MPTVRSYSLTVERHDGDGGYLAYFPALPGCQTWGDTFEAAVKNAGEALELYLETLVSNGDPLPPEPEPERSVSLALMVTLPAAA